MADHHRTSENGESPLSSEDRSAEPSLDLEKIRNAMVFVNDVRCDLTQQTPDTKTLQTVETQAGDEPSAVEFSRRNEGESLERLGRFEIIKQIGQGGFAVVYLARDPALDRLVALKLMRHSKLTLGDTRARFDREARATATLSHPNIVPVFETGIANDEQFIVAAYCPSISLREWFENRPGPVGPSFAAKIISLLADATEHAHQRGVIHRDLKPANILIESEDAGSLASQTEFATELLRVTDFGLARYSSYSDQLETTEGAIVGTPAYMSPEQARGESAATSFATDIYSLGVMLYELLTNELPILGKTHIETLLAIGSKEPTPLRRINKTIPRDLEAICLKCLSKQAKDRYCSAHDLRVDLNRWINGQPIKARRISTPARLAKWFARNPVLATAFAAISVALCFAVIQWRIALHQNERANRHRTMTQGVIDEMVSNVAGNPDLPPEMRKSITQHAVDLQIQLMDEEPDDHDIRRQTLRAFDRLIVLLVELCEHESALDATDQALTVVEPVSQEPAFAETKMNLVRHRVNLLRYLGETDIAETELTQAKQDNPQSLRSQARNAFESGMLKLGQRKFDTARIDFEEALILFEQLGDAAHVRLDTARSHFFYGYAELSLGNFELARKRMTNAEALYASMYASMKSDETVLEDYGKTLLHLGRIAKLQLSEKQPVAEADDSHLLETSRKNFVEAARLFQEVLDLNPLRLTDYGLLAMTFEYHVALEVEHGQPGIAEQTVLEFADLFGTVPGNMRERKTIGRILAEARMKLAKSFIKGDDFVRANQQLKDCEELVEALLDQYPNVEKLETILAECQKLLKETG